MACARKVRKLCVKPYSKHAYEQTYIQAQPQTKTQLAPPHLHNYEPHALCMSLTSLILKYTALYIVYELFWHMPLTITQQKTQEVEGNYYNCLYQRNVLIAGNSREYGRVKVLVSWNVCFPHTVKSVHQVQYCTCFSSEEIENCMNPLENGSFRWGCATPALWQILMPFAD